VHHQDACSAPRYARKPIELDIPITIAGMSFGALSRQRQGGAGPGAPARWGPSTTTGDGGMTQRGARLLEDAGLPVPAIALRLQPGRPAHGADAIEVVIGQGAKTGGGGMLLGQKVNPRVARMRTLPEGVDQRSACRPSRTGPARTTWPSRSRNCAR
jgi:glutamate synthase domain-containing protein 2